MASSEIEKNEVVTDKNKDENKKNEAGMDSKETAEQLVQNESIVDHAADSNSAQPSKETKDGNFVVDLKDVIPDNEFNTVQPKTDSEDAATSSNLTDVSPSIDNELNATQPSIDSEDVIPDNEFNTVQPNTDSEDAATSSNLTDVSPSIGNELNATQPSINSEDVATSSNLTDVSPNTDLKEASLNNNVTDVSPNIVTKDVTPDNELNTTQLSIDSKDAALSNESNGTQSNNYSIDVVTDTELNDVYLNKHSSKDLNASNEAASNTDLITVVSNTNLNDASSDTDSKNSGLTTVVPDTEKKSTEHNMDQSNSSEIKTDSADVSSSTDTKMVESTTNLKNSLTDKTIETIAQAETTNIKEDDTESLDVLDNIPDSGKEKQSVTSETNQTETVDYSKNNEENNDTEDQNIRNAEVTEEKPKLDHLEEKETSAPIEENVNKDVPPNYDEEKTMKTENIETTETDGSLPDELSKNEITFSDTADTNKNDLFSDVKTDDVNELVPAQSEADSDVIESEKNINEINFDADIDDFLQETDNSKSLVDELTQFTQDIQKPSILSDTEDIDGTKTEKSKPRESVVNLDALAFESDFLTRRIQEGRDEKNYAQAKLTEKERLLEAAEDKIKGLQLRLIRLTKDDEAKDRNIAALESELREVNNKVEDILTAHEHQKQQQSTVIPYDSNQMSTSKAVTPGNKKSSKFCVIA